MIGSLLASSELLLPLRLGSTVVRVALLYSRLTRPLRAIVSGGFSCDRVLPCHYVQLQLRFVFGFPPKRGLVFRISKLSKTEAKCALWLCTLRIAQISRP
jgi:hypothetical protein